MEGVDVARLDAGVAPLVQVQDVAVGEGDLGVALLGAEDVQALVLAVLHDVVRALQGRLLDHGHESGGRGGARDARLSGLAALGAFRQSLLTRGSGAPAPRRRARAWAGSGGRPGRSSGRR